MSTTVEPGRLPAVITAYLAAHRTRDLDRALACYTDDAVAVDEGSTYRGHQEIRDWLTRTGSEYTYTSDLVAAERDDDNHWVATHHLEGDFPGGTVDLRFQFTLRDDRIAELVIEP